MEIDNFEEYIEKHLIDFIKHELRVGYSIKAIVSVLKKKGHHKNIIDKAIAALRKEDFKVEKVKKHFKDKLTEDSFNYAVDILTSYINEQLRHGYKIADVKHALMNYGHSKEIINATINSVLYGKKPVFKKRDYTFAVWGTGILVILITLVILSIATREGLGKIILGFSVFIITFIIAPFVKKIKKADKRNMFYLVPLILILIFYYLGINKTIDILARMDIDNLAIFNFIISLIIVYIFISLQGEIAERPKIEVEEEKELRKEEKEEKVKEKTKPKPRYLP